MRAHRLYPLFNPATIAVVGASNKPHHLGYEIIRNLLHSDYSGRVYAVNPNPGNVFGGKTYPSVTDIPDPVDLAIIATPAAILPSIMEDCVRKGIKAAVITSAGFKEIGDGGNTLYQSVASLAEKNGIAVLGPNCLGFIRPSISLNASFAKNMAKPGSIAFVSQSGALCTAVLDWSLSESIGFSYFISVGEMMNVGFHDMIDYLGNDPDTDSILLYMESMTNARSFLSAARSYTRNKPIIVLKSGKSDEGSRASRSHTGNLAGNDSVFDAAFKRAGILRVNTVHELFDCAQILPTLGKPKNNRMAIITNAGGPAIIATDYLIKKGGRLPDLSSATMRQLDTVLPNSWSHGNPIDILGDADRHRYRAALQAVYEDSDIDALLVILTPQAMTNPTEIAEEIVAIESLRHKPLLAVWMGGAAVGDGRMLLEKHGIPVYDTPEEAIQGFLYLYTYAKNVELLYETPASIPHAFTPKQKENKTIISRAYTANRFTLNEIESKHILQNYGIPTIPTYVANSQKQAIEHAHLTGFPVAMKILSADILHKTEAGGIRLNLTSNVEVAEAYKSILASCRLNVPKAKLDGVLVMPQRPKKYELFIGCRKDPNFGPVIAFGMGGVAVEVFHDISFGLPPLNMALAQRMIDETKIASLLHGFRGYPAVDIRSIQFLLYKFAYLVMDFPEIKEVDINPYSVDEAGGEVLDAKIVLDREVLSSPVKKYSHISITPYPKEFEKHITLSNGMQVLLRPIRPEDEAMEAEMFTHFSEETQRFRFFTRIKDISHRMLIRYTQIDYDREIAIIAEFEKDGKKQMLGVVRLIGDAYNERAEFAIVVADPWQGIGLGKALMDYLLEIARQKEFKKIYAHVLSDNGRMLKMMRKRNFSIRVQGGDYIAELALA